MASRLDELIRKLGDVDQDRRTAAIDELWALETDSMTADDSLKLLRASALTYPMSESQVWDIQEALIRKVAEKPMDGHVPVVEDIYDLLSDSGRMAALALLGDLGSRSSLATYVRLLREYGPTDEYPRLASPFVTRHPNHGDIVFPALVEFATSEELTGEVFEIAIAFSGAGALPQDSHNVLVQKILYWWKELKGRVEEVSSSQPMWFWAEEYRSTTRWLAGLLLDLSGYLSSVDLTAVLLDGSQSPDPRLQMFGAVSMLRRGEVPDDQAIAQAAQQPEVRYWLFRFLDELVRLDLFPAQFKSQSALAEAEMANWLADEHELGREPDGLELMAVKRIQYKGCDADLYVFRFQERWDGQEAWMAGIAGPYLVGAAPAVPGLGATFSNFEDWESKDVEDHVEEILAVIGS